MSVKLVSILLLLSFWFPGLCYAEPDLASQEVRVGVIAPLSGPVANRGQDIARTIELLKPELEALAPGFQFKFIIEDGRCGIGPAALGAGRRLLDVERVHFLIISCSGSSLQVGPLAQRSGVLTMVVYSLHEAVSNIGDFIFRTSPSVRGGIKKLAAETTERGYKRIAILSEESEFTDHMADVFADFKGSQVVERVSYRREDTDSRMLLLRLRKAQPDFIFFSVMNGYTLSDLLHKRDEIKWEVPIGTYGMVDT